MKRILLSAVLLSSIGAYAQVGINTTEPTATLDVNGEVRVRSLAQEKEPSRIVTVDNNNVLKVSSLQNGLIGSATQGFVYTGQLGKRYYCNEKNNNTVVYVVNGAMTCSYNNWQGTWSYEGVIAGEHGPNYGILTLGNREWISGRMASTGMPFIHWTATLYVIDDSQYRK